MGWGGVGMMKKKEGVKNVSGTRGWELRRRRCAKRGGGCGFRVL